jgi:hypothetical protein
MAGSLSRQLDGHGEPIKTTGPNGWSMCSRRSGDCHEVRSRYGPKQQNKQLARFVTGERIIRHRYGCDIRYLIGSKVELGRGRHHRGRCVSRWLVFYRAASGGVAGPRHRGLYEHSKNCLGQVAREEGVIRSISFECERRDPVKGNENSFPISYMRVGRSHPNFLPPKTAKL